MREDILEILQSKWKYRSFRPLQEDIIISVLSGKDTLALMPTGGGKSLCYQVPALYLEGLTLVITPLIALMKDQVLNLHQKNINASAIHSGMNAMEVSNIISNCIYGKTKLLYVSPERLQSLSFRAQLLELNIKLIAVDEAHCISQWGHDFRPAYRKIHELREQFKGIPLLALTASATEEVTQDIQEQLLFKEKNIFKASYQRKNLSYYVLKDENKWGKLEKILEKNNGSLIIYVRNRKKTKEIAKHINDLGYKASFYHAGLKEKEKNHMQDLWYMNSNPVMVCTNAFGMGIDKPDVRVVVHWGLPDTLEAYYQEAGRAGRDGKQSYGIVLYDDNDVEDQIEKHALSFPTIKMVKQVYQALSNYYQVPVNLKSSKPFSFELIAFCNKYQFNYLEANNVLKLLTDAGYIQIVESNHNKSRLKLLLSKEQVFYYRKNKEALGDIIQTILRSYGGVFDDYHEINEALIAKRCNITNEELIRALKNMHKSGLLSYSPKKDLPQLYFVNGRTDVKNLFIDQKFLKQRKQKMQFKLDAMFQFVKNNEQCRNKILLEYFGEEFKNKCGHCDHCRKKKIKSLNKEHLKNTIRNKMKHDKWSIGQLISQFDFLNEEAILTQIRNMIKDGEVIMENEENICLAEKK